MSGLKRNKTRVRSIYVKPEHEFLDRQAKRWVDLGNDKSFNDLVWKAIKFFLENNMESMKLFKENDSQTSTPKPEFEMPDKVNFGNPNT